MFMCMCHLGSGVERLTRNEQVPGSNPGGGSRKKPIMAGKNEGRSKVEWPFLFAYCADIVRVSLLCQIVRTIGVCNEVGIVRDCASGSSTEQKCLEAISRFFLLFCKDVAVGAER